MNSHSQSDRETAATSELAARIGASRKARRDLQQVLLSSFGLLGTIALLALPGCPANLENAQAFDIDNPNAGAPPAAAGASNLALLEPPACVTAIMNTSCATVGCHKGAVLSADLNLDPADPKMFAGRLINVTASHGMAAPATGCVSGQKLIDTQNPDMSWLLLKVTKSNAELNCGFQMPLGVPLDAEKTACIRQYVQDAAAKAAGAGSGGM